MDLGIFRFVDEVLDSLEKKRQDLDCARREIKNFFEGELEDQHIGYLNITARVKSSKSLKEKILRYDYYNKYQTPEALYQDLSDLIGLRIECRFIDDEIAIYRFIKQYFNKRHSLFPGFYFNAANTSVLLELESKQPKNQKNGIKMYRIDGKYFYQGEFINFELQIKSLVNIFWSEIEHKIIYKNYNYIIADKFYKDIMKSIKNSLTTIDQQLLLIANEFERKEKKTPIVKQEQLETLLSKVTYDIFATHMKNSIGLLVDFRKSCDSVIKYVLREADAFSQQDLPVLLTNIFNRLAEIENKTVDFDTQITFNRPLVFQDNLGDTIGRFIVKQMNEEFQWNLFFRILFEIENDDWAMTFEQFIAFYTNRILKEVGAKCLAINFDDEANQAIVGDMMERFGVLFLAINKVEMVYDNVVLRIIDIFNATLEMICHNIFTFEQWKKEEDIYLQLFSFRVLSIFDIDVEATQVLDLLEDVRQSNSNIEIHKSILKYIDKL